VTAGGGGSIATTATKKASVSTQLVVLRLQIPMIHYGYG